MVCAFGCNVLGGVSILKFYQMFFSRKEEKVAIALLVPIILGSLLLALCSSSDEVTNGNLAHATVTSRPTAAPLVTATPAPLVQAWDLCYEREDNADRYDARYKGNWVRVSGEIVEIEGGRVYLDADSFRCGVALYDLSDDVRIGLSRWDDFTATCKVGNFIFGRIRLKDCFVE